MTQLSDPALPGHAVVALQGELDLSRAAELRKALIEAADSGRPVVVDLARVTFVDSCVIGLLVGAAKRLHARGDELHVLNARAQVMRVIRLTGLDRLVRLDPPCEPRPAD